MPEPRQQVIQDLIWDVYEMHLHLFDLAASAQGDTELAKENLYRRQPGEKELATREAQGEILRTMQELETEVIVTTPDSEDIESEFRTCRFSRDENGSLPRKLFIPGRSILGMLKDAADVCSNEIGIWAADQRARVDIVPLPLRRLYLGKTEDDVEWHRLAGQVRMKPPRSGKRSIIQDVEVLTDVDLRCHLFVRRRSRGTQFTERVLNYLLDFKSVEGMGGHTSMGYGRFEPMVFRKVGEHSGRISAEYQFNGYRPQ